MARKLIATKDNTITSAGTEPLSREVARPIFGESVLAIDYNFAEKGILDDDITFSRASGATQTGSDGYIKFAPNNVLTSSEDIVNDWTKRGSVSVTAGQSDPDGGTTAYLFDGVIGSGLGDVYQIITGLPANAPYVVSFYIKKVTSTGTLYINNPQTAGAGQWNVDLSKIGTGWERITASHAAVTVVNSHKVHTNGGGGIHVYSGGDLDFYFWHPQIERSFSSSDAANDYISTGSGSAVHKERLDFDHQKNAKGLLIEEARTNKITSAINLSSGISLGSPAITLASNIVDPSGGNETRKITQHASNVYQSKFAAENIPVVSPGVAWNRSIYCKAAEMTWVKIQHYDSANNAGVYFDLANGQIGTKESGTTSTMEDVGNGWYRCSVTYTATNNAPYERLQVALARQDNDNVTYTGDGVSGIYIYGGQLEQGSFPTSLIPTYGATADRAADIASVSSTAFSRFFKDTEGTIVVDVQEPRGWKDTDYNRLYSFNDGSHQNRITAWLDVGSGQEPRGQIVSGNTNQGSVVAKAIPLNTGEITRVGQTYATDRHYSTADSSAGNFDGTVTLPTGLNTLNIGSGYSGVAPFGGWIRRLRYFNKRKSNAQVQKLTDTSFLLDKFKGAKAAHSLRSLRDGRDNSPVTRIRREYDSFEADYTANQVTNGELENDFKSEKQTTLPLDVSCEAEELITNGHFDSNTTGWTAVSGSTLAVENSSLKITADAGTTLGIGEQLVNVQVGKSYRVTYDYTLGTSTNVRTIIGTSSAGGEYLDSGNLNSSGSLDRTIVATSTNLYVALGAYEGGTYSYLDNVSVKEVNPIGTGFSTRKINSSYTGKAMRCRNQGNVEVEVGFDDNNEISLSSPVTNSSQNLLGYSEDFGQWTLDSNLSRASGVADPFGGNNAWTLTSSGTNQKCLLNANLSSGYHTYSVYIRRRTGTGDIRLVNYLGTQVVTVTDEWTRVSRTDNYTGNTHFSIRVDTNGDEIDVFGAQIEETQYESTGTEKVTNGTFDNGSTGWDISNTTGGTVEVTNGALRIASTNISSNYTAASQDTNYVAGKKYKITFDLTINSANEKGLTLVHPEASVHFDTSGPKSVELVASSTAAHSNVFKRKNGSFVNDFTIDNVSILEYDPELQTYAQTPVVSNDGSNTTATDLQSFAGKENLIIRSTYTSGQSGTSWNFGTTLSEAGATETSPTGSQDAFKLLETATTQEHSLVDFMQMQPSQTYVFSTYIKSVNGRNVKLFTWQRDSSNAMIDVFYASFNLTNGTIISDQTSSGLETSISDEGNDWYRISMKFTTSANVDTSGSYVGAVRINLAGSNGSHSAYAGDTTKGIIQWGAQLNTNSLKTFQATTGTALTGDVNVVNWYDQAGGEDFVNATASEQPRIVMGSELVTDSGGKASVYFEDADFLENDTLAGQNRLDSYYLLDSSDDLYTLPGGQNGSYGGAFSDDGSSSVPNSNYTDNIFVNGATLNPLTRDNLYEKSKNHSQVSHIDANTISWTKFYVGKWGYAGYNFEGKISEMVFFPNMDSSPKRFPIEQNMLRHFEIYDHKSEFNTDMNTWGGDSSSGWYNITNPSYTSIVNGEAILDGSQGTSDARTHVDVTVGKYYEISVDMRTDSTSGSGSARLYMSDGANYSYAFGNFNATNTMTTYSKIVQPTQNQIRLYAYNTKDDKTYYDNITVREVGTAGYVTTLYDQTGNNCHALQSTAANQPQIVSGGDLIKSGNHPAWYYNVSNPQRNLAVQGMENLTTLDAFFVHETGSDQQFIYPSSNNSSYFGFIAHNGSTDSTTSVFYGSPILEVNGVQKSPSDRDDVYDDIAGRKLVYHRSATTANWTGFNVGFFISTSNNVWNLEDIKFSEMVFWDSDQHSNQSGIESNINTHYNIY